MISVMRCCWSLWVDHFEAINLKSRWLNTVVNDWPLVFHKLEKRLTWYSRNYFCQHENILRKISIFPFKYPNPESHGSARLTQAVCSINQQSNLAPGGSNSRALLTEGGKPRICLFVFVVISPCREIPGVLIINFFFLKESNAEQQWQKEGHQLCSFEPNLPKRNSEWVFLFMRNDWGHVVAVQIGCGKVQNQQKSTPHTRAPWWRALRRLE